VNSLYFRRHLPCDDAVKAAPSGDPRLGSELAVVGKLTAACPCARFAAATGRLPGLLVIISEEDGEGG
jgi:hypothetical protein